MHPFTFFEPGNISRRYLWYRDKRRTGITHVCQADRIPCRSGSRCFIRQLICNVMYDSCHHRLDHITRLRSTCRNRCYFYRWNSNTDACRINIFIGWVSMQFIDDDETAWITQLRHCYDSINAFERRQHHGEIKIDLMLFYGFTSGV